MSLQLETTIYIGKAVPGDGNSGTHTEIALLSITTTPAAPFVKDSKYYNSTEKKIYTAIEDNTWTNATVADPVFGAYYTYSGKTYTWDGDSLEIFELEDYQLVKEKTNSYSSQSTTTYPSSKALYDGLASKIGIVDRELKVSNGDTIVVDVEDDSTTEIFSDGVTVSSYGDDSEGASIYVDGINGARIDVVTDTNQINIVTDSNGANISKTENNTTEKVVWNKATGTDALTIIGYPTNQPSSINIGRYSIASGSNSLAIGAGANAYAASAVAIGASNSNGNKAICINCNGGNKAIAGAQEAIQLGYGTNNNAKTLQVYEYQLLDGNTGKIPADRLGTSYDATKTQSLQNVQGTLTWSESSSDTITISDITSFQVPNTPLGTELPMPVLDDIKDAGVYKINFDLSAMAPGASVTGTLEVSDLGGSIQQWYQTCISNATFIFSRTYENNTWSNWYCISGFQDFYTPGNLVAGSNVTITTTQDESGYAKHSINASIPTPTQNWYTGNTGTTITILDTSSANLVDVYKNGVLLQNLEDYSISGTTLTLITALEATDKICVKVDNTSSADLQAIQTLLSNI